MNEELQRLSLMTMPQALKYRADTHGERLALREVHVEIAVIVGVEQRDA